MYADYDSNGKVSIMELNSDEVYALTEALVRYATNPDIISENRALAKKIVYTIPNILNLISSFLLGYYAISFYQHSISIILSLAFDKYFY